MIEAFLKKLEHQLLVLSCFVAASALSLWLSSIQPIVRISFSTFLYGLLSACALILIRIGVRALLFLARKWKPSDESLAAIPLGEQIGLALVLAGGEEVFLRGFLFAPLLAFLYFPGGKLLAHLLQLGVALALHARSRVSLLCLIPEALLLAFLYQSHRSLFLCVTARFVGEILWLRRGSSFLEKITILLKKR